MSQRLLLSFPENCCARATVIEAERSSHITRGAITSRKSRLSFGARKQR
jgi:hypothetical protein